MLKVQRKVTVGQVSDLLSRMWWTTEETPALQSQSYKNKRKTSLGYVTGGGLKLPCPST